MWKIDYDFSTQKFILSLLAVIICSRLTNFNSFGDSLISTLFFLLVIPALSVSVVVSYGINVYYIILSYLFTCILLKFVRNKSFHLTNNSFSFSQFIFLVLSIVTILIIYFFREVNNFDILSLLSNVYVLRAENDFSGILSYLLFWIPSVFIFWILYIAVFSAHKFNFLLIIIAFTLSFLTFLFTGLKTQLFTPFLIIFLFLLVKKNRFKFYSFNFIFPGILLSSGLFFSKTEILAIIDRILYLPALLQLRYIEYFSNNDLYLFKGSKIEFLIPFSSNYNEPPGYIIDAAFGGSGMNGNTGSFGSIFGDIGFLGLLIVFPLFIAALTLLFNSCSNNKTFISLFGVYYGYVLINAPPIDIILTHGLLINVIILVFNNKSISYE